MIPRPVELKFLKLLRELKEPRRCLLAVSGGIDSMALLYAASALRTKVPLEFMVAHIHHGGKNAFRDSAFRLVKDVCEELDISFASNLSDLRDGIKIPSLKSENDLRRYRLENLKIIRQLKNCDYVAFAHHKQDLLETRLLRLIRGTGPQGLGSMQEVKGALLRPFLTINKTELQNYMTRVKGRFVEDPSNNSSQYLRNWLRREWLPALEVKRPGASENLATSLETIVENLDKVPLVECLENQKILRPDFHGLSSIDKRRVLGNYLRKQGFRDYGLSHINELVKRLDVEQKDLTFRLLKRMWLANARHIWCE